MLYDRVKAVEYARKWALSRNPAYYNFDGLGGDCTNFASQVIYAGSRVMNYKPVTGWYYINAMRRTASWTGVEYLYNFLVNNSGPGPYGREAERAEVLPGDIVQLGDSAGNFYHSPVIMSVGTDILVAAHSNDVLYYPLSGYAYSRLRFIKIEGVRP